MFYYIKKFWKMSGIIIFMLFIDAGLSSYRSLALMESLEELVRGNFRGISVLDPAESALCGSGAGVCGGRGHFGQACHTKDEQSGPA